METQKIKDLENSAVELTVTIGKDSVVESYDKIINKYAKTIQIKGFRKGKAPRAVIENKFGDVLKEETMYTLIEDEVQEAIENVEEENKPLQYSSPKLSDEENLALDLEKDFSFSFTYDIFPKYEIPAYEGYTVEVSDVEIGEQPLAEELKQLQDQNAMVMEKDVAAENESIVTVDYCELDEHDEVIEGTAREGYVFTVGTGYNIYKFDDDIIGMKAGDEKVFEKSFDEEYDIKEYAGKSVKIKAVVKAVKVREIPELDDDFAQDISEEYETLEDLKNATLKKIEERLEAKVKEEKITKLYDQMLEKLEIALPESMIQAELENSWRNFASQSGMQEDQLMQILEMQGKEKADLLNEWKPQAERSLKIQLLLDKITAKEGVTVTDEEVEENESLFEGIEDPRQKDYYKLMWKEDRKMQKTIDLLLEKNTFTKKGKVSFKDFMGSGQQA